MSGAQKLLRIYCTASVGRLDGAFARIAGCRCCLLLDRPGCSSISPLHRAQKKRPVTEGPAPVRLSDVTLLADYLQVDSHWLRYRVLFRSHRMYLCNEYTRFFTSTEFLVGYRKYLMRPAEISIDRRSEFIAFGPNGTLNRFPDMPTTLCSCVRDFPCLSYPDLLQAGCSYFFLELRYERRWA